MSIKSVKATVIIIVFQCLNISIGENLPRIITQDGHLIFQTGDNFNITFKANGGAININEESLTYITDLAKKNQKSLNSLEKRFQLDVEDIHKDLTDLKNKRLQNVINEENFKRSISEQILNVTEKFATLEERQLFQSLVNLKEMYSSLEEKFKNLESYVHQINMLLIRNECNSNPCQNGGTCIDIFNSFMCNCPPAWEGPTCENDVNECDRYQSTNLGCQNDAICVNLNGTFRCECKANWYGVLCSEQHDDCTGVNNAALCGHGSCINQERVEIDKANYRCHCDPGWTYDKNTSLCTVDIDECKDMTRPPCSENPPFQCINVPGHFYCGPCQSGYNGDGYKCIDIDECAEANGGCSTNPLVKCTNIPGSRICGSCPSEYEGDGITCTYVEICKQNNGNCHFLALCEEVVGNGITRNRTCKCPPGYQGNGEGPSGCTALFEHQPCSMKNCLNGYCEAKSDGTYKCICNHGYTGPSCSSVLQCTKNPCANGGTCEGNDKYYVCHCSADYTGQQCETVAVTRNCNATFTAPIGTFSSPGYPIAYPNNAFCYYHISAKADQFIILEFDKIFHITTSFTCVDDYLVFYQGNSSLTGRLLKRYCGYVAPLPVSTNSNLFIQFVSDGAYNTKGFKVNYRISDCNVDYTEEYGEIFSTGWPGNYPTNANCVLRIMVPENNNISLFFNSFHIEFHLNCLFDFLEVREGNNANGTLINRFCGSIIPSPIFAKNNLWLRLQTDGSRTHQGFHITYTSSPLGCGGNLTGVNGTFASPGFPNQYSNNHHCEWLIRVGVGQRVKLEFSEFRISGHPQCSSDFVMVYDGSNEKSTVVGQYCGTNKPAAFISSSNGVLVKFVTDNNSTDIGFKAKYNGIL